MRMCFAPYDVGQCGFADLHLFLATMAVCVSEQIWMDHQVEIASIGQAGWQANRQAWWPFRLVFISKRMNNNNIFKQIKGN